MKENIFIMLTYTIDPTDEAAVRQLCVFQPVMSLSGIEDKRLDQEAFISFLPSLFIILSIYAQIKMTKISYIL